jgi:hypothetical protein
MIETILWMILGSFLILPFYYRQRYLARYYRRVSEEYTEELIRQTNLLIHLTKEDVPEERM